MESDDLEIKSLQEYARHVGLFLLEKGVSVKRADHLLDSYWTDIVESWEGYQKGQELSYRPWKLGAYIYYSSIGQIKRL